MEGELPNLAQTYVDITNEWSQTVLASGGEVAIYGASKFGWFVRATALNRGLKVKSFLDQSAGPEFTEFHGTPVQRAEDYFREDKETPIVVCIFNDNVRQRVVIDLQKQGANVLDVDPYALLFCFFFEVASRSCDENEFARSIANLKRLYGIGKYAYGQIEEDLFVSPFVVGNVTQKCNLKCIDCGQYIPYYDDPKTFSVDNLVDEIASYCETVDLVPEVSLHGGEPFLHPKIGEICQELAKIPNLVFINLITNGTLYPKPENWKLFREAGVDIHQSDYRRISKRQAPIFELCDEHTIYCDINWTNEHEMWWRMPPVENYNRSKDENDEIYRKCVDSDICAQIIDGKLYRCPVAAHNVTKHPNIVGVDYVNLSDNSDRERRSEIVRSYLTKKDCLSACGYCDPFGAKLVKPALQLSPRNKAIIDAGGEVLS